MLTEKNKMQNSDYGMLLCVRVSACVCVTERGGNICTYLLGETQAGGSGAKGGNGKPEMGGR